MARPGLLALAIIFTAELTCSSVSATARHLTSSNPSPSVPFLAKQDATQTNPLLLDWDIPPYDLIKPDHLVPGVKTIVSQLVINKYYIFILFYFIFFFLISL